MKLNRNNVPKSLWEIMELAEFWGISDDSERIRRVNECSSERKAELRMAIDKYDDLLDLWLAGKESFGANFSDEYIAFSAMRMAADYL